MIRAGVMDKEMVQALGINVKAIFSFVFLLGAGMAALGGFLLAPYSGVIFAEMGYAVCDFSFHSSNHWRAREAYKVQPSLL